jgi:hypothetical protein
MVYAGNVDRRRRINPTIYFVSAHLWLVRSSVWLKPKDIWL